MVSIFTVTRAAILSTMAYRTRKERSLLLACDSHTYEKAGKYRILVKVIDIFSNDIPQAFDVEVK